MQRTHHCRILTPFHPADGRYWAKFDLHNHSDATNPPFQTSAPTMPLAVCRAALLAATDAPQA